MTMCQRIETTERNEVFYINFYHGVSFFSRAIRFRTWSDISHVSITAPTGRTFEAVPRYGVVDHFGLDRYHTPGTRISIYRFEVPHADALDGLIFLREQVGKKYDWGGITGFVFRKDWQNAEKWFCSEYAQAFSIKVGLPFLERVEPHKVDPADLRKSPRIAYDREYVTRSAAPKLHFPQGHSTAQKLAFGNGCGNGAECACAPEGGTLQDAPGRVGGYSGTAQGGAIDMQCVSGDMQHGSALDPNPDFDVPLPNAAEAPVLTAEKGAGDALLGLPNAITLDASGKAPEWVLIPYADVPINLGQTKGLQRLNRKVADGLVNWFGSWRGRLANAFGGFPVYKGHPDCAFFRERGDTDKMAYAWILDLKATDEGLLVNTDWTPGGRILVETKSLKFFSPFFLGPVVGHENGVAIYEPRYMQSGGLTNTPNWPVAPLVNAAMETEMGGTQMDLLQRLLALIGIESVKTEDDVVGHVNKLLAALKKMRAAEEARWAADSAAREALVNAADPEAMADAALALMDASVVVLEQRIKDERTGRAALLVNAAIVEGRLMPAQRDNWLGDLVNADDFDHRAGMLAGLQKQVKTESVVRDLGTRSASLRANQDKALELVNSKMADNGALSYEAAFGLVRREHPELFAQAEQEQR